MLTKEEFKKRVAEADYMLLDRIMYKLDDIYENGFYYHDDNSFDEFYASWNKYSLAEIQKIKLYKLIES